MAAITNWPGLQQNDINGAYPNDFMGNDTPDGDRAPWKDVPSGSRYIKRNKSTKVAYQYEKRKEDNLDDDWGPLGGVHVISQTVTYDEFTDGGSTSGTLVLDDSIPLGAFVLRTLIENVTGFTGDSSAALIVGDGTDTDRYNTSTVNVFTTATVLDAGAVSGTQLHTAAKNVTLTITSGTDWGAVTAGQLTIKIFYYA